MRIRITNSMISPYWWGFVFGLSRHPDPPMWLIWFGPIIISIGDTE